MNLNQANIIGRVTRDPEIKVLPAGAYIASFGLATNRTWKDKAGAKQEATEFHNIVVFGLLAEKVVAPYVKKGQEIFVSGRLQTRTWDDTDSGKKMYRTEIVVSELQLGAHAGEGGGRPPCSAEEQEARGGGMTTEDFDNYGKAPAESETPAVSVKKALKNTKEKHDKVSDDINPEDIPF